LHAEDELFIADWRGDDDQLLGPDGPTLGEILCSLATHGVIVRGLLWRSHPQAFGFSEEHAGRLARMVNEAGGQVLLDERVRRGGSHHQKLVLLRHRDRSHEDVAFVGGVDLCHGRRDDDGHDGDPQAERLDPAYGRRPPWHDLQVEVRGPALDQLFETFRERWNDRTPLERRGLRLPRILLRRTREPDLPEPLPRSESSHSAHGRSAVQVLRTYPAKRPGYPFAPGGERSIARLYGHAVPRARSLVYVEDQYFWSEEIAGVFERTLRTAPDLRLIVVVPRHPDHNGALSGPSSRVGQIAMMDRIVAAAPDRVAVYDLEDEGGAAIYVHAKAVVIDDALAVIGSDNMNRRSWTHDSELSIAILDEDRDPREPVDLTGRGEGARRFARALRLGLWREHLGVETDDGLIDPVDGFRRCRDAAGALDAWYDGGRRGPRPPGRLRVHRPRPVAAWQRVWAWPLYRLIVDPDGRPRRRQRGGQF
jgi:phosphatidylserine/phosphatidylglycerophosphate/cardiolipin synthase-like enzyme